MINKIYFTKHEMFKRENLSFNINEYINSSENIICRLCLNKFQLNELEDLFQTLPFSGEETIAGYITKFANIPINKEDCFSKVVCRCCLGKLNETVDFRNSICSCNDYLINLFSNYSEDRKLIETGNDWAQAPLVNEEVKVVIKHENSEDNVETDKDVKIDVVEHNLIEAVSKIESDSELREDSSDNDSDNIDSDVVVSVKKPKRIYVRDPNLRYPCKFCDKVFKSKPGIDSHLNVHTGNYYKCEICEKKFTSKPLFAQHKKVHNKDFSVECKECGKLFEHPNYLQNHMEGHSDIPKYQCDLCGKRFRFRGSLDSHKIHHRNPIEQKCEICNRTIRSRQPMAMKRHMERHSKNREQICPKCGKTFTSRDGYKAHLKNHNGELDYKCELCPKMYSSRKGLREHMAATHSAVKPYSCEICGKTFALKTGWYRHGQVHAKENPFTCRICEKKFGYSSHLKGHMRSVHGIVEN